MDLAIEANRNSALFNTMQQVLDVYNPLLHKARPTIVNQTKHRIRVNPTRWGNTLDQWNGNQTVRFDLPRIGSLVDFSLRAAFRIPGTEPSDAERKQYGDRGYAKETLKVGDIEHQGYATKDSDEGDTAPEYNNIQARGRLDRLYADDLLGFNMIRSYTISSKSRRIFSASGEYLLVRFSQMDSDMQENIRTATTPVSVLDGDADNGFYSPATTYLVHIPLFMFFNEHITSALDVNFSEEVHIDIELRSPSELFYYGQLGDMNKYTALGPTNGAFRFQKRIGGDAFITYDQSNTDVTIGTAVENLTADPGLQNFLVTVAYNHIKGVGPKLDAFGLGTAANNAVIALAKSNPTFKYPNVDSNGECIKIQFEANADYIIQDTDAYRALRQQMFPEGSGLTTITYDTSQETFQNIFDDGKLLSTSSGGTFVDPSESSSGISIGDQQRYIDLQLRTNNLCFATHFMVRKHSDMGGDENVNGGSTSYSTNATSPSGVGSSTGKLGSHRIYTRCLPVHHFQVLAAGRTIYESDGKSQLHLTQAGMYNGTGVVLGLDYKAVHKGDTQLQDLNGGYHAFRGTQKPFAIYSINWGLQASRLENTGCLSFQNLNNPTLRIYFKAEEWSEFSPEASDPALGESDAIRASKLGVQVDIIHEHFNVVTINSGNGEITSGLNQ